MSERYSVLVLQFADSGNYCIPTKVHRFAGSLNTNVHALMESGDFVGIPLSALPSDHSINYADELVYEPEENSSYFRAVLSIEKYQVSITVESGSYTHLNIINKSDISDLTVIVNESHRAFVPPQESRNISTH